LRVSTYLCDSSALASIGRARVGDGNYRIRSARRVPGGWLVALAGIGSHEQALALRGLEVLAYRSDLPPPAEGEWYLADLVGLRALDTGGAELGVVAAASNFGAGDILVLRSGASHRSAEEERMVPLLDGVLVEVRLAEHVIVLAPPEVE
jgi:16S rRNA processing protein RimM